MEDLFDANSTRNLLPADGLTVYHGPILSVGETNQFFSALRDEIPWRQEEVVLFGKRLTPSRKVAWFGDEAYAYTYSGSTKRALPWTNSLSTLKSRVEMVTGETFNSCLLNFYHHGGESMGWHSDDERTLEEGAPIASLSLGACRKFRFKHKRTGETVSLMLENGSLLVMKEDTQRHWLHALPPMLSAKEPRINLTFRRMRGH